MSSTERTDRNTARNSETRSWTHRHKRTLHIGEGTGVNQAVPTPAAVPAPPCPVPCSECTKARTCTAATRVPAQSGEPDAGINLAKITRNVSSKKKPAGLFLSWIISPAQLVALLRCQSLPQSGGGGRGRERTVGARPAPLLSEGLGLQSGSRQLRSGASRPRTVAGCVLLLLPSISRGSYCVVCEFSWWNRQQTSSFLSLSTLHQLFANWAPWIQLPMHPTEHHWEGAPTGAVNQLILSRHQLQP